MADEVEGIVDHLIHIDPREVAGFPTSEALEMTDGAQHPSDVTAGAFYPGGGFIVGASRADDGRCKGRLHRRKGL